MKRILALTLLVSALLPVAAFGQPAPLVPPPAPHVQPLPIPPGVGAPATEESNLPRFDLDFPGGGPKALVAAIEKASGKPLNAIVPSDTTDVVIPPLKMSGVTVPELFEALQLASAKLVQVPSSPYPTMMNQFTTSYGFVSAGKAENRVWYFKVARAPQPPPQVKLCRFYQLEPFLQQYKIEDVITAIRTGWGMQNVTAPELKFHPETKLLIAVGSEDDLKLIDSALQQLKSVLPSPAKPAAPSAVKSAPSSKGSEE